MLKPCMEVLILSILHVPPEKHPTENGIIGGKLWSHQVILEIKQVSYRAQVHSLDLGLGMHMIIWNRLQLCDYKMSQ